MDLSKSGDKGKTRKPRHRKIKGGMEAAEIKQCDEKDSEGTPIFVVYATISQNPWARMGPADPIKCSCWLY